MSFQTFRLYWLWKRGLREFILDKQRARIGREILNENAYLSREDGYRYPRCDLGEAKERALMPIYLE